MASNLPGTEGLFGFLFVFCFPSSPSDAYCFFLGQEFSFFLVCLLTSFSTGYSFFLYHSNGSLPRHWWWESMLLFPQCLEAFISLKRGIWGADSALCPCATLISRPTCCLYQEYPWRPMEGSLSVTSDFSCLKFPWKLNKLTVYFQHLKYLKFLSCPYLLL